MSQSQGEAAIDISKACRLCLVSDESSEMTSTEKQSLESWGISVHINPRLPPRICKNCNAILEFIQKFRKMCENSKVYLQQFGDKEQTNDSEEKPSEQIRIKGFGEPIPQELIIPHEAVSLESFQENDEFQNIQAEVIAREETIADEETGEYLYDIEENSNDEEGPVVNIEGPETENEQDQENEIEIENDETSDGMWIEETCEDDDISNSTIYVVDDCNSMDAENSRTEMHTQRPKRSKILQSTKDNKADDAHTKKDKQNSGERHVCEICGNHYKRLGALETHRRRHLNERPFDCEICGDTFSFNFLLERHMRKHTGDRPFTCEYCKRKFYDRSTMSRHQKIHRNERAYKCNICEKTFTYYSVLKIHIMSHTGEKPYSCGICEKAFHRASDLKNHLETLQHRKDPRVAVLLQDIKSKSK